MIPATLITLCSRGFRNPLNSWVFAIIGFIIAYCLIGFVAGLIVLSVSLCTGAALVFFKQKKGLHTKKEDHGVFIFAYSRRM